MKISATIVTYNGFAEAKTAADSLLAHTKGAALSLYMVDNASPDGTGKCCKNEFDAPVTVLALDKNVGFGLA